MTEQCTFIALDIGTHAVRACVFSVDGATPVWAMGEVFSCDINLYSSQPRHIEQNPAELLQALQSVYGQALDCAVNQGLYTEAIGVGIAVQRSSVMAWERISGNACSSILSWQDTRAFLTIEQLSPAERESIMDLTGLRPSPHYGASKLLYLQQQLALQANNNSTVMGPLAAWLIKQLTHQHYCDPINAARTLLFNRRRASWDKKLCNTFGAMHTLLPVVQKSAANYGAIKWAGSEQLSGDKSVSAQLMAVLGDQNAAYLAMRYSHLPESVNFKNPLVMNIGSGAFVLGRCTKENDSRALGLLTSLAFSDADTEEWLMEGTVNNAGTALTHWRENLPESLSEHSLFNQLPQWLAEDVLNDETQGYFYLNAAAGIGSPFWLSRFKSSNPVFMNSAGEVVTLTIAQQAVAVINSVAFLVVANILQFQKSPAVGDYDGILATGGLSRLSGLMAQIADLCGLPIFVTKCHEATLQGTAMLGSHFMYKPCLDGHIVAAKKSSPVLLKRYERYIQLIQAQAL